MNILTNELIFRYDETEGKLFIFHPDRERFPTPLGAIPISELQKMTLAEASQFIGEKVILLSPGLREKFSQFFFKE